jgi:negative regulator of flagellin synthesis FlgM
MKINNNKPPENQDLVIKSKDINRIDTKNRVTEKKNGLVDRVDISGAGRDIAALMNEINRLPDIREDKVKAIKEAIEANNYNIDVKKIAEKILRELIR